MPPGRDGLYYFSTYLLVDAGELASFNMVVNEDVTVCTAQGDNSASEMDDYPQAACSAMAQLNAGMR